MRIQSMWVGALMLVSALVGCQGRYEDPPQPRASVGRAEAELADIRSRLPGNQPDAEKQVDTYAQRIFDSSDVRDRKAEVIESRIVTDVPSAQKTIGKYRGNVIAQSDAPANEWAQHQVTGKVRRAGGKQLSVIDAYGTPVQLEVGAPIDPPVQEGAEVRAAYEVRDGANVLIDLEVLGAQP